MARVERVGLRIAAVSDRPDRPGTKRGEGWPGSPRHESYAAALGRRADWNDARKNLALAL